MKQKIKSNVELKCHVILPTRMSFFIASAWKIKNLQEFKSF